MPIRLSLLGPVSLAGVADPLDRRVVQQRRIALLALMAGSPDGIISRDRLLGALWPEADDRTARHLLADSVYVLRRALGADAIVARGEQLQLSAHVVRVDVVEFRQAAARSQWSAALDLYRGDFLDGFFVRDALEFDRWAGVERDRLRVQATGAATALARSLEGAGRLGEAVAAAERALELAPCDEAVVRDLLRLLAAAGNGARAEAVARAFVERLAAELGVSPSPETLLAIRRARALPRGEPVVVVPTASPGRRVHRTDSVTARLILLGRHQWQQRTRAALERAIDYLGRAVERDPRAAEAWSALADAWAVMGGRAYLPPEVACAHAMASIQHALALDDALSAAHASLGGIAIVRRRWGDADAALGRAIELDPTNAVAHHWRALVLLSGFGARDEAIREQTLATRLDPLAPMPVGALAWQHYLRRDYEQSRSDGEPAADLNGDLEEGHAGVARIAARLGDETTVRTAITAGMARRPDLRGDLLAEQASALAVLGDVRRARRLAAAAEVHRALPLNLALAWSSIGDAKRAFACLDGASFTVYWAPHAVWWDPRFDAIRDDARFRAVRERAALSWRPEWAGS